MISVGCYRILHKSEFQKFEKLHRIFRTWSEDQLDLILAGKIHLRRSPMAKRRLNAEIRREAQQ